MCTRTRGKEQLGNGLLSHFNNFLERKKMDEPQIGCHLSKERFIHLNHGIVYKRLEQLRCIGGKSNNADYCS